MVGAVLVVIAMVVVFPTALFLGGALWAAVLGHTLTVDADDRFVDAPT